MRMSARRPSPVRRRNSMTEDSVEPALRHSLNQSLATTTFDPEDFAIAGAWLSPPFRPTADGAPAMISVGLNADAIGRVPTVGVTADLAGHGSGHRVILASLE